MTKWAVISEQFCTDNTPEYGYGDYPECVPFILLVVEADTERKAQAAARKVFPGIRFGYGAGVRLLREDSPSIELYKKTDERLSPKNKAWHKYALKRLAGYIPIYEQVQ